MPEESLIQLGAVAIIFLVAIREFFVYLKSRKEGGNSGVNTAILEELKTMNNNHLHSLEKSINEGNEKIVNAITDGNLRQIQLLGEIKGRLENR